MTVTSLENVMTPWLSPLELDMYLNQLTK